MERTLETLSFEEKRAQVEEIRRKKKGETDIDWIDILGEFDLDINVETLRKAGVGIKLVDDANMFVLDRSADLANIAGEYIERQKMRDLTRQVNEIYRSESRSELLRETIAEAITNLSPVVVPTAPISHSGEKTLVVGIGDLHYGAKIKVEGLMGETINEYNSNIFEARMWKLLSELESICNKEDIGYVTVFLVGDLIDGMLRQSQLMKLQYGMVESTMRLSEFLAQWLNMLSIRANVSVYAVSGNHSEIRPLGSKKGQFEDENLEKIVMWYLAERLRENKCIEIQADVKKLNLVKIRGYNFLLLHGDGEKKIEQIARDAVSLYGENIDFFVCGHKHREQELPSGMTSDGNSIIIRVPSICGVDSFANSKGYGGRPGAVATVIEKGYGRRCVYPIQL